jgi:glycosyltransferase involved in cell wall biosynthesis
LAVLGAVQASVQFDIIGPVGDAAYWAQCQPLLATLPRHVTARYLGAQSHAELQRSLGSYELLLLPTRAENNGYVILEALLAGCALLISNATPWRGLQGLEIGWDHDVDNVAAFARSLDEFARLAPEERLRRREMARQYGLGRLNAGADVDATRQLMLRAVRA